MAAEHRERADSDEPFLTDNYGVRTSSRVEFAFVATPTDAPAAGWPAEERLRAAEAEFAQTGVQPALP